MILPEHLFDLDDNQLSYYIREILSCDSQLDPIHNVTPAYYIYSIYQTQNSKGKERLTNVIRNLLIQDFITSCVLNLPERSDILLGNIAFLCEAIQIKSFYVPLRALLDRGNLSGNTGYFYSKNTERKILRTLAVIQSKKLLFESVWELYWNALDPYFWDTAFFGIRRSNVDAAISFLPGAYQRWNENNLNFDLSQAIYDLSNQKLDRNQISQIREAIKAVPRKIKSDISEQLINKGINQSVLNLFIPGSGNIVINDHLIKKSSKFCVYYHSDLDGIVSCILFMYCIRKEYGIRSRMVETIPVDFDLKSGWDTYNINDPAAILDFLYHPKALVWLDHHQWPFSSKESHQHYEERSQEQHEYIYWDKSARSVAQMLFLRYDQLLKREYKHIYGKIESLVKQASTIDSAEYRSVDEWYDCNLELSKINLVLLYMRENNYNFCNNIVRTLFKDGVEAYINSVEFEKLYKEARNIMDKNYADAIKVMDLRDGIVKYDSVKLPGAPFYRFFPYKYFRDAQYTVAIYKKRDSFEVSVGKNPWKRLNDRFDVGTLCREYGGGGHVRVGGITKSTYDEADSIADTVIKDITNILATRDISIN